MPPAAAYPSVPASDRKTWTRVRRQTKAGEDSRSSSLDGCALSGLHSLRSCSLQEVDDVRNGADGVCRFAGWAAGFRDQPILAFGFNPRHMHAAIQRAINVDVKLVPDEQSLRGTNSHFF